MSDPCVTFFSFSSAVPKETDDENSSRLTLRLTRFTRTFETNNRKLITERSRKRVPVSNFVFRQFLDRSQSKLLLSIVYQTRFDRSRGFYSFPWIGAVGRSNRGSLQNNMHSQPIYLLQTFRRSRDYSCILSDDNSLTCASWFEIRLPRPGHRISIESYQFYHAKSTPTKKLNHSSNSSNSSFANLDNLELDTWILDGLLRDGLPQFRHSTFRSYFSTKIGNNYNDRGKARSSFLTPYFIIISLLYSRMITIILRRFNLQ